MPFLNVTVPAGTPLPGAVAVTTAVNVTDWLNTDGLADELTAVEVEALFTTCAAAFPLLFAHPVAPVKAAEIVWLATLSAVVLNDAWPEPSTGTLDAKTVAPSEKVTVPTGTPLPEVVVEVKVTDWPKTEGFGDELAVVVVGVFPLWTTCTVLPLLTAKRLSEAYVAVMVWLPRARDDVLKDAIPLLFNGTCASTVLPSAKVT